MQPGSAERRAWAGGGRMKGAAAAGAGPGAPLPAAPARRPVICIDLAVLLCRGRQLPKACARLAPAHASSPRQHGSMVPSHTASMVPWPAEGRSLLLCTTTSTSRCPLHALSASPMVWLVLNLISSGGLAGPCSGPCSACSSCRNCASGMRSRRFCSDVRRGTGQQRGGTRRERGGSCLGIVERCAHRDG